MAEFTNVMIGNSVVRMTVPQAKKLQLFLKYYRETKNIREATQKAADELGVTRQAIDKVLYNKKYKSYIKNELAMMVNKEDGIVRVNSDIYNTEAIVSIAWIIGELRKLYESTGDERLKKDILIGLAKINTQYADTLTQDMQKIRGMSLTNLIDMAVDILKKISGDELAGNTLKILFKKYNEFNNINNQEGIKEEAQEGVMNA